MTFAILPNKKCSYTIKAMLSTSALIYARADLNNTRTLRSPHKQRISVAYFTCCLATLRGGFATLSI
jgi:hypothetical protein